MPSRQNYNRGRGKELMRYASSLVVHLIEHNYLISEPGALAFNCKKMSFGTSYWPTQK